MNIWCALGCHEAGPAEVYNGGYYFSHCRRCGTDMIRSGAAWSLVPEGHRVVWKDRRHRHSLPPDLRHALPMLHPAANLPAVRSPFRSWSRSLVARQGRRPAAAADAREEEREERAYPQLLIVAAVVGGALQMLFGWSRS